jgi:hypothetical protein
LLLKRINSFYGPICRGRFPLRDKANRALVVLSTPTVCESIAAVRRYSTGFQMSTRPRAYKKFDAALKGVQGRTGRASLR